MYHTTTNQPVASENIAFTYRTPRAKRFSPDYHYYYYLPIRIYNILYTFACVGLRAH